MKTMNRSQKLRKQKTKDDSASPPELFKPISHEIQTASPSPVAQHDNIFHINVNINSDDDYHSATHTFPSVQKKWCLQSKLLVLCIRLLIYACTASFTAVVGGVCSTLLIACSTFAAIAALPLLVVSFLAIRLFQCFRNGDSYDKAIRLKLFIRTLILLNLLFYLGTVWVLFALSKRVTVLKHLVFIGLSIAEWLELCNVIFGIYLLSYAVSIFTINSIPLVSFDHEESGLNVPEGVLEIIDCLIFWLAESVVMTRVPAFKHHKILGLYTQRWIEVSTFVLIGYNIISLSIHLIVWVSLKFVCEKLDPGKDKNSRRYLMLEKFFRKKYSVYCANGMKHNINFILSSLLLLVTWKFYIGSHLDESPRARDIMEFGTWTCASVLVCSILWLIKTCVLLTWEAHSVYDRLHSKILEAGKQLYFLGLIGRHKYDIFKLLYESWEYEEDGNEVRILRSDLCSALFPTRVITLDAQYQDKSDTVDVLGGKGANVTKKLSNEKRKRVKDDLLVQKGYSSTLYCVQQVAGYFLTAKKTLSQENFASSIVQNLKKIDNHNSIKEETVQGLLGDDWEYFIQIAIRIFRGTEEISFESRLRTWMEQATKNCVFLANTVSCAQEVVDCLNNIISCLLVAATFILWLLLTGLATTKVLVLIVSPLLAATFIFGDTCKNLFQGIIFVFVVHPFDVGDLCVIDGKMMEVRTIGVWKTMLSIIATQEEVIYSNSELFNKSIINHKTNFDWNDNIEVDVTSFDMEKLMILREEVKRILDSYKDKFTSGYNCVELLMTSGENTKLAVYFRHRVNLKNITYFECVKEKRKLRTQLVLEVRNLMIQISNGAC